jgi:ELWxxDGT repeat protein
MLKNLDDDVTDTNPEGFTEVDGLLFFAADDVTGERLWVTDGTEAGTLPVDSLFAETAVPEDVTYGEFLVHGSKLYFTGDDANGDELFMVDAKTIRESMSQVTDINKTGDSYIGELATYNGEVFFEADDGIIGDELYKITADGSVVLVKDINTDAEDTSPNGDPKNFIEYKGLLYFNGNDGDNGADKHDSELWRTDGTTDGTVMVEDIWPGGDGNGSNPQQMFVFNDKLYFNAKVETANQVFRYDGENPVAKITAIRDDGFAVPFFPTVDEANGKVYLKVNTGKFHLCVINADETYEVIVKNESDHGFAGTEAGVIYKDKFYYNGDNGTDGDELFVSDGTADGTFMLKDINPDGDADPEQFTEWNGELYFIAEVATGMQLWKTDGTEAGTVMVAEPNVGDDADMDHLKLYNDKLYFAATDGTNGVEVWTYDGTTASMLKDLDGTAADSDPEGFIEVDGLLLFVASDGTNDVLYVTNGTSDYTMTVAEALNSSFSPVKVNYREMAVVGSILYFSADDANGYDDIYSVDVDKIWSEDVTFTVTDADGPLAGATVAFDGTTAITDDAGVVTFPYVRMGTDLAYTVTMDLYEDAAGTVTVADEAVEEDVVLVALPTYNVTFTVTDGTDPVEGAEIGFNETTGTTNASGVYTFTEVYAAADMAYTITKAGYEDVTGTTTVVDADVSINEALTLIVFTVTFNVTDGTNALEGASVSFNSEDKVTDASGVAVFSDVVPGTGLAYSVTLDFRYFDADGTVDVDGDKTVDVTLALTSVSNTVQRMINVYPNPTTGRINIEGVNAGTSWEIYNVSQQKVAEGLLDGNQLDLNLETGFYFLKLAAPGDQSYIQKIVVE